MTRLGILREQLDGLRRRRRVARLATAWVALALALLWSLAGIFLLDWQLVMSWPQRLVAVAIGTGVIIWIYRRYARPLLATHETDLDVALLIEREQHIDSDLVAALQFESAGAASWGSPRLQRAVVDRVARFSHEGQVDDTLVSAEPFVRRGLVLAATLLVLVTAVLAEPNYASTFLARLFLSSRHYPTRTVIDEVQINGAEVADGRTLRLGYGQPVGFSVRVSGQIPSDVRRIELRPAGGGGSKPIELTASAAGTEHSAEQESTEQSTLFVGELPQLVDSLEYQVYLGDAWTDPSRLEVIALPVVEPKLTATPPEYARAASASSQSDPQSGARQLAVLEGSHVDLALQCANKRLQSAELVIDKKSYPLESSDADGRAWSLPTKGSPLASINQPVKYQIQVTDEDGLQLPHPIDGYLRIQTDRPPTVTAAVDVQYFLPTAGVPQIRYTVGDDFGISQIRLFVEVVRAGSTKAESPGEPIPLKSPTLEEPVLRPKLPISGRYGLSLAQFKLAKGDELHVTLEATDYRGEQPGKSTRSEPLVLHITDEAGILAALGEADQRAAQQMDALIQRQTQTGGSK